MYSIENDINTFSFEQAVLQEVKKSLDGLTVILDQVLILENNQYNKDIVTKRTNNFSIHFSKTKKVSLFEEGYSIFDADLNLIEKKEDREVDPQDIFFDLEHMQGCEVDEVIVEENKMKFTFLVEDHTWRLEVIYEDRYTSSWERFMSL